MQEAMMAPIQWLPPDLIRSIAELLLDNDVVDYISFRAVCREWRLYIPSPGGLDSRFRPRRWIMLSEGNDANLDKSRRRFLNLSTGQCLMLRLPQLNTFYVFSDSDGLLFLIDLSTHNVRLFNPFTQHLFDLPSLPSYFYVKSDAYSVRRFSSSSISTDSCPTVMLLDWHFPFSVYFAKPGDPSWNVFDFNFPGPTSMLCFRDQFYFTNSVGIQRFHIQEMSLKLVIPLKELAYGILDEWYILEFNKEMMLLNRRGYMTFQIYRVDLEANRVVRMFNSRDLAIFIGQRCFALSLNGLSSLKPNSVYYYTCKSMEGIYRSVTMYNIDDQEVEKLSEGFIIPEHPLVRPLTLAKHMAAYSQYSY